MLSIPIATPHFSCAAKQMRPLLILFILVIGHVASEDILFNTSSTGCEGPIGCNWNDPAIWIGGRVPSSEADSVHLNDTRPNILVIFNNSSPNIYINSVVVAGVTFGIQNASLSLNTLVVEDSTVSLGQNSSLYSYESITVQYNSTITLDGSALYLVESATGFVLDNSSQLHSGLGSKLILYHSFCFYFHLLPLQPLLSILYLFLFLSLL